MNTTPIEQLAEEAEAAIDKLNLALQDGAQGSAGQVVHRLRGIAQAMALILHALPESDAKVQDRAGWVIDALNRVPWFPLEEAIAEADYQRAIRPITPEEGV